MTGEHFSSSTGKELDKEKDPYIRFRWENKKGQKRTLATVLEKEKVAEDKELMQCLQTYLPCESNVCPHCQEKAKWPLVRFEFYNWATTGVEKEVFVHEKCLEDLPIKGKLDGLKLMGKNPTFLIELNCLSTNVCRFFSKASDFRNCQHITLRFEETKRDVGSGEVEIGMSPLLFCKRAHPGEFFLESEAETYWNVENAGLALMGKRMMDSLKTPEARAQIDAMKNQNPEFIEGLRKILTENPGAVMSAGIAATFFAEAVIEKTPEEKWEEAQQGNDVY